MSLKVFMSVGRPSTREQEEAIEIIRNTLKDSGLNPRKMFQDEWSYEQPLRAIRSVIKECDGAVIIAFTRYSFPTGFELGMDGNSDVANVHLPTVWNQIEAAMAYMNDLPLFVVGEQGLLSHGLIAKHPDWNVFWTSLEPANFRSDAFRGWVTTWKEAVEGHSVSKQKKTTLDLVGIETLTIGELVKLLSHLPVSKFWALLTTIMAAFVGVATIAYKLGGGNWPWG